jgi:hypothetical protein
MANAVTQFYRRKGADFVVRKRKILRSFVDNEVGHISWENFQEIEDKGKWSEDHAEENRCLLNTGLIAAFRREWFNCYSIFAMARTSPPSVTPPPQAAPCGVHTRSGSLVTGPGVDVRNTVPKTFECLNLKLQFVTATSLS